jgi:hypothetical protein
MAKARGQAKAEGSPDLQRRRHELRQRLAELRIERENIEQDLRAIREERLERLHDKVPKFKDIEAGKKIDWVESMYWDIAHPWLIGKFEKGDNFYDDPSEALFHAFLELVFGEGIHDLIKEVEQAHEEGHG